MRSGLVSVIYIAGMTALSMMPAHARDKAPVFITRGAPMEAPRGFIAMCENDKTFCAAPSNSKSHDDPSINDSAGLRSFADSGWIAPTLPDLWPFAPTAVRPAPLRNLAEMPGRGLEPMDSPTLACPPLAFDTSLAKASSPDITASKSDDLGTLLAFVDTAPIIDAVTAPSACQAPTRPDHGFAMLINIADMPTAGLSTGPVRPEEAAPQAATALPAGNRRDALLLKQVNNLVNSRVRQRPDSEVYAQAELWSRSGIGKQATGDCEDLAIEKRYQLLARGFDPTNVSFAVVFSAATGLHTVLVARTEDGDMVLDSANPWIRRADQTGYSWISIQSTTDQMAWVSASV